MSILFAVPSFRAIRSQLGAASVDSSTLSLANYPLSELACPGTDEVVVYWAANGAIPADTLTLQALMLNGDEQAYTVGSSAVLAPNTLAVVQTYGGRFTMRVSAVSVSAATNVQLFAASVYQAPSRVGLALGGGQFEMACGGGTAGLAGGFGAPVGGFGDPVGGSDEFMHVLGTADFKGACARLKGIHSVNAGSNGKIEQSCVIGTTTITADLNGTITGSTTK